MAVNPPSRIPCAFFDAYLQLFATMIICEIHLVLEWESRLDPDRLGRAVMLALDAEPVAGCRFVTRWIRPYWERVEGLSLDRVFAHHEADEKTGEALTREFFAAELDPSTGPQVGALLLSLPSGDRLLLKINHQVADAAGVKQFAARLSDIYCALGEDPAYQPQPNLGPRGLDQIFGPLLPAKAGRLARLWIKETKDFTKPVETTVYKAGPEKEGPMVVVKRDLSPERMAAVTEFGRMRGATINDMLVAALMRAFARQLEWRGEAPLRIGGTVDLRRYLSGGPEPGLCNLSSLYPVNLGTDLGRDFGETLGRVKSLLDWAKANYIGLGLLFGGAGSISLMPFAMKRAFVTGLIKAGSKKNNHPPGFTNMGTLDPGRLSFGQPALSKAWLVVPGARPPFFVLGVSGFSGGLTFSAGVFESSVPAARVAELFEFIDKELPGAC